jgi:RNA polymerase sigma-70 factor (ECF subfamily)
MVDDPLIKQLLKHQSLFMGYLMAITRDLDAAEEIFQNVAVVVLREGEKEPIRDFQAWAKEIVRRQALYYLREKSHATTRIRPTEPSLLEGLALVLDESMLDEETGKLERKALRECVRKLPERSRQILVLRYEERRSFDSIARMIDSTESAVQRALSRVRKLLHDCVRSKLFASQEASG